MIHAVEIQFAGVLLRSERRIGEIDVAVAAHHDVVRRVEALAFEARGQHFDFAVLQRAGHAPLAEFAGVEAALGIERPAIRSARFGACFLVARARHPLMQPVHGDVAIEQKSFVGPHGSFGEMQAFRDALNLNVIEILSFEPGLGGDRRTNDK